MNGYTGRKVKGGCGWSRKELKQTSKHDRVKAKARTMSELRRLDAIRLLEQIVESCDAERRHIPRQYVNSLGGITQTGEDLVTSARCLLRSLRED